MRRCRKTRTSEKSFLNCDEGAGSRQLVSTEDGSFTLRDAQTGELYHNRAGAYSEALFNYVTPSGALHRLRSSFEIAILDVCFGLGYNSLVLIEEALALKAAGKITIYAIDRDESLLAFLPELLKFERFSLLRENFHPESFRRGGHFRLAVDNLLIELLLQISALERSLPEFKSEVDYVFHDPFSPRHAPEFWTIDIFRHYFSILSGKKGAVLTYSAAGAVRGGLWQAGFAVKKTAALGAKSGGTIGLTDPDCPGVICKELDSVEIAKLSGLSGIPYSDSGFSFNRQDILRRRSFEQERHRRRD